VRAAVCRAHGARLAIEDLELAAAEGREVRVEVAACAVCHSDVAYARGAWGGELPAVYGHEAAGVVTEVGPDVDGVRPGDRVVVSLLRSCGRCAFCRGGEEHLCDGPFPGDSVPRLRTADGEPVVQAMRTAAFAEEVLVDVSQVASVPRSISLEAASLLGCGVVTGVGAVLDKIRVAPGSSVVVVGAGGVGINVVQGAALAEAAAIVAVEPSRERRAVAKGLGATHGLDPDDGLAESVRELTGGRGADYVFVTVGSSSVVEQSLGLVRRGGTVAVVGMPPSDEAFQVVAVDLVHDDVRLVGCKIGAGSGRLADVVPRLLRLYEEGRLALDPLVTGRYPLERVNDAMEAAARGEGIRNVVVMRPE
jgi:S-(hydroxymethyl)glutathione dehydrogenase / alcohol dehydrogenase